jgi:asparagine synthase (glutamine-hydrolysing)
MRRGLQQLHEEDRLVALTSRGRHSTLHDIALLEATQYMRNQLLRDTDWASMAHSLEVRVPLVDVPLWRRLTARLGPDGLGRGKRLLAQAPLPPIPEGQLRRPKTGFYVPVWEWAGEAPGLDVWRGVSALTGPGLQGPRRWAYTVFRVLAAELGVPAR